MAIPPQDVVPMFGMLTGMVMVSALGLTAVMVSRGPIGQAIARRLAGKSGQGDQELRQEVMELRDQLAQVEHRLAESEERLDFTERLLAGGKHEAHEP